jgi:long-subunit acyl-CoA synthetase (AMP-forming)
METVNGLVERSIERFGPQPALMIKPGFRTRIWRYRDLGQQVPRIARALLDAGAARGDRVAIWAVNRPEWGLAFLAAAHAGLVGVPLDVRSTDDFATKVVEQTEPKLVFASRQTEEAARRLGLPVILIESLPDLARGAEPLPAADISAVHRLSWIDRRGPGTSPRGDVEVVFGDPIFFAAGTDHVAATARLEEAVAAL